VTIKVLGLFESAHRMCCWREVSVSTPVRDMKCCLTDATESTRCSPKQGMSGYVPSKERDPEGYSPLSEV
jgi:hypothetical protein